MLLNGRSILVTGASRGIGRSTAALLASAGADVYAVARSADALAALAGEHHPRIIPLVADLTIDEDRASVVKAAGRVDVLVNNAGRSFTGLVEDMSVDDVRSVFELNVLSNIDLTQRVLPQMLERRSGHIVNIGSIAGYAAIPPLTIYSTSKAAMQGFTEGLRREVSGRGVRVSLINPGPIDTGLLEDASDEALGTPLVARMTSVPSWMVAFAVLRAIALAPVPGYSTIAVPRVVGLSRLAVVPGVSRLMDVVMGVAAPHLRAGGDDRD